ncbi:MAG: HAMP domain-containing sensor histidine kinase [Acidimicrobiales bacterium]
MSAIDSASLAMPERRSTRLSSRLALAFVAVAVAAVALLATLTLLATNSQVSSLVATEQHSTVRTVDAALVQAYRESGNWTYADLTSAYSLAASGNAQLVVRDAAGHVVASEGGSTAMMSTIMGAMHGGAYTAPPLGPPVRTAITVHGLTVGEAIVRFPVDGLTSAQQRVRSALESTVFLGAGLASLLALVVAWFVSRRITRPLARLTDTVHSIESGHRDARVGQSSAPGEVGELAASFDRMADALDREDVLRRQLLADVAHELRTPITIVQASLEQMVDGVEPVTTDRLASLGDEVLRLGRLVHDLETLAAAEAAGLNLVKAPVNVASVAADIADLLAPAFDAAEVDLQLRLHEATVYGDDARIGQIVTNLLTNALKFSPEHSHVTLGVEASDGLARMEVTDEGPGISAAEMPRLFDRFWRGTAGRRTSGSGIGLAVVAGLVEAHGGRIEVSSEPGRGARFTVFIPLR